MNDAPLASRWGDELSAAERAEIARDVRNEQREEALIDAQHDGGEADDDDD